MRRAAIVGSLAVCVVALVVIFSSASNSYRLHAVFSDAEGISADYWVKVDGAVAGTVTGVTVTRQGQALVTMDLNRGVTPVGAGASAEIRPTDLLGENYVQLNRGDLNRPQPSGTTIPASRTSTPVELDEVLNMLTPSTRAKLRILINEAGIAMAGRGANFNALLQQLPPALSGARSVVATLAGENTELGELIDRAELAVGPIDQHRDDVEDLITQADSALGAVAVKRAELAATVRSAPTALNQITATLDRLDVAAQRLKPAAALLTDAAPDLTDTLRELPGLASSLRSPLATATSVAPELTRLGTTATPDVNRLTPTVSLLSTVVSDMKPLVYTLGRGGGVDGLLGILNNWSTAAIYQDGLSHYFDFHVSVSQRFLQDAVQRFLSAGVKSTGSAAARAPRSTRTAVPPLAPKPAPAAGAGAKPTKGPSSPLTGVAHLLAPVSQGVTTVSTSSGLSSLLKYLVGR